ncbi:transcriptional regulator [Beijerinckiaceae bacterium]|nr:transcriptional regulator [Beijerinckiaceae bacterium]
MTRRTNFGAMECPVARSLECVGEWWSILILRDAFQGLTKFDEFEKSLGIAPNMLTRRLKHLTANGMLKTRLYSKRPPRHEYLLTQKSRDFFPVLVALLGWANKHLASRGVSLQLADRDSLATFEPIVVNDQGNPVSLSNIVLLPGVAASAEMHRRLETVKALRPERSQKRTSV